MMDSEDAWLYFWNEALEKINLNNVLKIAGSVCNTLGFKLGKLWKEYASDLTKTSQTSPYLTSL